jgi:anti-sigma regulatory factor (Ser/Thr protein kinase)/anti-anti-sigma regulatory factor
MSVKASRTVTLIVPADADAETIKGFCTDLDSHLTGEVQDVELDCSLLEHATSMHVNTLWRALSKCEDAGVAMRLVSVTYGLERVLKVLDLYDLFVAERDGVEAEPGQGGIETNREAPPMFQLAIEPSEDGIRRAADSLHDFTIGLRFGELFAFDVETAFYEVTTNIRIHGGLKQGENIHLLAFIRNGFFRMRFEDSGSPFDPTGKSLEYDPARAVMNRQRQGFGLVMIRRMVDCISYERVNDRMNVLNLDKRISRNGGRYS